jgi:signal transduction histidine kinase
MDTFILAATSLTIAVSLMITGKINKLQASFAGLCASVFVSQAAITVGNYFHLSVLMTIRYFGLLAVAPLALLFFRFLTGNKSVISRRIFFLFLSISICGAFFIFTPLLDERPYFHVVILCYMLFSLGICYIILMRHVIKLPAGNEKRRLGYLLVACPVALILSHVDLLNYAGFNIPEINGVVTSTLLYFILLIIAYPQLRELHDFFARSLVIFVSTVTGAVIIYFAALFFKGTPPSITGLLLASFLIVISLSPLKMILKKIFSYFYPESKDVFTSLYEFDEKLEREKAVMLQEMAPVFAHEIRNPLGSIKGAAQYLKEEAATDEQKELLNVIIGGTDRLNAVVSKFLDYARPYQLNLQPQNMNVIIQKAISIIAANKLVEDIAILQELDKNLPGAEVDEQQLMQVILNIALNAIEAMPQGGTLTFRTSSEFPGEISVIISDTGSGINKKDLKDIFKPFFTTKEKGVGLGLAICQKIIKEHGGSVSVKSIPSGGTAFYIKLKTAR